MNSVLLNLSRKTEGFDFFLIYDFAHISRLLENCGYMPVIPAFSLLKQEDHKIKACLGYIVRPCLKKQNKITTYQNKKSWKYDLCMYF
jgi:hypothetical protein